MLQQFLNSTVIFEIGGRFPHHEIFPTPGYLNRVFANISTPSANFASGLISFLRYGSGGPSGRTANH
jgi:hypothetical protein